MLHVRSSSYKSLRYTEASGLYTLKKRRKSWMSSLVKHRHTSRPLSDLMNDFVVALFALARLLECKVYRLHSKTHLRSLGRLFKYSVIQVAQDYGEVAELLHLVVLESRFNMSISQGMLFS